MKNHIAVKFIAVLLATLSLFAAIASGLGIIVFTAGDLYERKPEDVLLDSLRDRGRWFAESLAEDYARKHLGNCPDELLINNNHYFNHGYYGYQLKDLDGTALDSLEINSYRKYFTYTVGGGEYMKVLANYPEEELHPTEETYIESDLTIYDNLPTEGAEIYEITFSSETSSESFGSDESIGYLSYQEDGTVHFQTNLVGYWLDTTQLVTQIAFIGKADDTTVTLYEIISPHGVGEFYKDVNDQINFISYSASPKYQPKVATESFAETTAAYDTNLEVLRTSYYDHNAGETMVAEFVWEQMPEYTVELYLAPGATDQEAYLDLLTQVWQYRNELFYVLGASLLIFAVMAVYLCCAAGKKPGVAEIQASGFNAIPLDLYGLGGGFGIALIVVYGVEVAEYLVRYSPNVLVPFILFAGCGCCLIFVGFCFACAAQFKTPNGYWWRNLLFIRCFALAGKLLMGAVRFIDQKVEPVFVRLCKRLWQLTVRFCKRLLKLTELVFTKTYHFFDSTLTRFFRWLGIKFTRFFGLLPLTWQWLLVGMLLISIFLISLAAGSLVLLWIGVFLTVIVLLYVSHAFGILLESTKRMGKGDLETKVSDQFLIGSFKEFAADLNALADVAVIAAQKQLKSERMKTELITNVSHDIKTPLTSIINYVDLLQRTHTPEDQEAYLEVLSRQSRQLKKLIEDLMEMSKASTGNMAVDIAAINAGEAIHQALGEFADKLEKAQLTPVFRQPEEPIYMKADGRLAWRVMSNLLGNAVKYALPGTRLYIDLMDLEGKVIISFKNISREELNVSADELLERFVRGDASRNTEGSGLGLNIAQSLMEIQKGQLQLLVDGDLFKVTLVFPAVKE